METKEVLVDSNRHGVDHANWIGAARRKLGYCSIYLLFILIV
jgi:hypothetical protein